jgi:hypothetical protein
VRKIQNTKKQQQTRLITGISKKLNNQTNQNEQKQNYSSKNTLVKLM